MVSRLGERAIQPTSGDADPGDAGVLRRGHAARRGGHGVSRAVPVRSVARGGTQSAPPPVLDDRGVVPNRGMAPAARPRLGLGVLPGVYGTEAIAMSDAIVLRA